MKIGTSQRNLSFHVFHANFIFTFRFGTQTPTNIANKSFSLQELQDKAKTFLTASPNSSGVDNAVLLYQLIEDFCRETDRYMETEKKDRDDLQLQVRFIVFKFSASSIY